ncbi:MAG: ATP-grasp domain-containing protein [Gemmatimonadales bacterium]
MPERSRAPHLLVAGVTTRALALSAVRAGYRVTAIDAFADLDLEAAAQQVLLARPSSGEPYGPVEAANAGANVSARWAAYTSNFENFPAAVARLARGRQLLGNPPETLHRARDPVELMRILRRSGLRCPQSRSRPPSGRSQLGAWLLKPRRSGGGHGVRPWAPGSPVSSGMYLQQRITGAPGSISFASDGINARILGFSRQLVGDPRFGAGRFRYCGSILGAPHLRLFSRQAEILELANRVAAVVAARLGLIGLNGVDFIVRQGIPYPIEVNPRYSASMELIERAHRLSIFGVHALACKRELAAIPPLSHSSAAHGKAIVFARQDSLVGDSRGWLGRNWVADVPRPGEYIRKGRPICTVFARGRTPEECRGRLVRRARMIYRTMRSSGKQAA